jgi:NADPH:quinone reductase-like Zn-dependent oxidoreductase
MKAIVYTKYGSPDVLEQQNVPKPTPKDNEILIKVHATTVNYGDITARDFGHISASQFNMPGLFWFLAKITFGWNQPKKTILGSELSGEIVAIGKDVKRFNVGDQVFAYPGQNMGAYAEYLSMPETGMVAEKPENLTFEEAAAIPYGAITALSLLRAAKLKAGQKILILGASGGIGAAAVQLAKYHFSAEVTGVCSTQGLTLVKSLGADHVIDYSQEDFTQNNQQYDLILDILGKGSFTKSKKVLTPKGIYLLASFKTKQLWQMLLTSKSQQKVICALSSENQKDLELIKELCEQGKIKAFINKNYPLEQTAEAHKYVESGRKTGSIVINVA